MPLFKSSISMPLPLDIDDAVAVVIIEPADATAPGPAVGKEVAFDAMDGFGDALFGVQGASSDIGVCGGSPTGSRASFGDIPLSVVSPALVDVGAGGLAGRINFEQCLAALFGVGLGRAARDEVQGKNAAQRYGEG